MQSSGQRGAFRRGPARPGSAAHGASPLTHRPENEFYRPLWLTGIGFPYPIPRLFQYLLAGPAGLRCRRRRNLASRRRPNNKLVRDSRTLTCAPPSRSVQDPLPDMCLADGLGKLGPAITIPWQVITFLQAMLARLFSGRTGGRDARAGAADTRNEACAVTGNGRSRSQPIEPAVGPMPVRCSRRTGWSPSRR